VGRWFNEVADPIGRSCPGLDSLLQLRKGDRPLASASDQWAGFVLEMLGKGEKPPLSRADRLCPHDCGWLGTGQEQPELGNAR
jgi:hypothetical protein